MGEHSDPNDNDEGLGLDPGNSPPVAWTESLTGDEIDEISYLLATEFPAVKKEVTNGSRSSGDQS